MINALYVTVVAPSTHLGKFAGEDNIFQPFFLSKKLTTGLILGNLSFSFGSLGMGFREKCSARKYYELRLIIFAIVLQ